MYQPSIRNSLAWDNGTTRSDWNFDTVKSTSAMGTFRSITQDFEMPPGMEVDDDHVYGNDDDHNSIDTGAATKGSDPLLGWDLAINPESSRSALIIQSDREEDIQSSDSRPLGETFSISPLTNSEVESPTDRPTPLGAPPAYTGSVRNSRRASYNTRTSCHRAGTVICEADVGTGVDTIRPVKMVGPADSFVGGMRQDGSGSISSCESARAGKSIVDEVVLPILQNVNVSLFFICLRQLIQVSLGDSR